LVVSFYAFVRCSDKVRVATIDFDQQREHWLDKDCLFLQKQSPPNPHDASRDADGEAGRQKNQEETRRKEKTTPQRGGGAVYARRGAARPRPTSPPNMIPAVCFAATRARRRAPTPPRTPPTP